jgi:hypothetical protein
MIGVRAGSQLVTDKTRGLTGDYVWSDQCTGAVDPDQQPRYAVLDCESVDRINASERYAIGSKGDDCRLGIDGIWSVIERDGAGVHSPTADQFVATRGSTWSFTAICGSFVVL